MINEILSDQEMTRYCRQILLPACDIEGQEKLKQAKVLLIGVGGLGCAAAQYLGAAGIGELTLVDFDQVELSNLQRQILHATANIGDNKAQSGQQAIAAINPEIKVNIITTKLVGTSLYQAIERHDVVVDCCDNLATRVALNKVCFELKIPLISGAAIRMEGMVSCFDYHADSPCYQCFSHLFGEQQLSCMEAGVLSPIVGIIGSIQAAEAIKMLTGIGTTLVGRVLMADISTMSFREMKLNKSSKCIICNP
ncbi:MAG: molybdopterin-synthase adenylyltransferase MoeB [Gammaproteobacteria bacterium]|nr:molybdopterin-synthase adenylyltransferase MoeB [Gammaproteobacteria bacterium]